MTDRDALLPEYIRDAEKHDPQRVIAKLEPVVLERRAERLKAVIGDRLASVAVVFDAPHDPHNGAAVIRSCDAFGVQSIHVLERTERFLTASTVSRGTERWVDVHGHTTAASVLATLREQNIELVAAEATGELVPEDLANIPRMALVLGNEKLGVGPDLLEHCKYRVRVPMRGFVESLNVSVTCAILLAAATRGRKGDLSEADRIRLYARGLYFSVREPEILLS